ncbi:MAG: DtxR family transcriptional regulator [Chitinivibrionales bacterium]
MNAYALTPTLEDYLEVILHIITERTVARSMDIAEKLNVRRPTVTVALRSLAEKGLIHYEPRSFVTLTEKGKEVARCIDKRHHVLRDTFTEVFGLDSEVAEDAACKMEHGMSSEVCRQMTSLLRAARSDKAFATELKARIEQQSRDVDCQKSCDYGSRNGETSERADSSLYDLNLIKPGASGTIKQILGKGNLKKRLTEMGITAGQTVKVIKAAPLDDPIQVKIRNYNLSLRREEAANILVEKG